MVCKNCETEVIQNYCPNCGAPVVLKRINGQYILKEISSVLNFDRGILYTIRELLLRPGKNIQTFVLEDRNRLVKPIIFIIITSLIYTLAQQFLHFEDGYVNAGGFEESTTANIFGWIQKNYGYANILMAIFIAGWIKIFFRKYEYNYFEILILLCFVMGIGMLIYTVFGIIESTTKIQILHIGGIIALVYTSWAIGRFFDKNKKVNYFKGVLSYLLGMITFFLAAIILGMGIDLIQGI
ncbi:DUF3667 domain-containing protein [Flavobacterium sp.]|uniref:DUF3667 domain-containing protein n=1 Tax=Flavobacterium sp. TaxID=239 RepID=UPI003D27666D